MKAGEGRNGEMSQATGRWPANLIHDGSDEVVGLFPAQAGAAAPVHKRNCDKFRSAYGQFKGNIDETGSTFHGDTGSAARFFYCAKTSKRERGEGNNHPTVKPIALMQYLCRLVTPPGGTVLDPFMGSGSTGIAAGAEGFDFIGIELDPDYFAIAQSRTGGS
jgi:site-specific DNA-methyltransferase (adenine-specific)